MEELAFYIQSGVLREYQTFVNNDFHCEPWEFIDTELAIPINHIEKQVKANFIQQGVLVAEKLTELLTLAVLHSGISFYGQKMAPQRSGRELLRG